MELTLGHGIYWINGARFIAVWTEGDTEAYANESFPVYVQRYGVGRYEVRKCTVEFGQAFSA